MALCAVLLLCVVLTAPTSTAEASEDSSALLSLHSWSPAGYSQPITTSSTFIMNKSYASHMKPAPAISTDDTDTEEEEEEGRDEEGDEATMRVE